MVNLGIIRYALFIILQLLLLSYVCTKTLTSDGPEFFEKKRCLAMLHSDRKIGDIVRYLHHEHLPALVEQHRGHDVRDGLLDDGLVLVAVDRRLKKR